MVSKLTPNDSQRAGFQEFESVPELLSGNFVPLYGQPDKAEAISLMNIIPTLDKLDNTVKPSSSSGPKISVTLPNVRSCIIVFGFSHSFLQSIPLGETKHPLQGKDARIAISLDLLNNKLKDSSLATENPFDIVIGGGALELSCARDDRGSDDQIMIVRPMSSIVEGIVTRDKAVTDDELDVHNALEAVLDLQAWREGKTQSEQQVQFTVGSRLLPSFCIGKTSGKKTLATSGYGDYVAAVVW